MSGKLPSIHDFRRIVIKVGSSLLIDAEAGRVKQAWLASLVDDVAALHREQRDILVVSSGAIALGRSVLRLPKGSLKLEESQAAAAVGQIELARTWSEALGRHGIGAGSLLRVDAHGPRRPLPVHGSAHGIHQSSRHGG